MRFYLVDRIEAWHPGERAEGIKCLTMTEEYLEQHFPGWPVMPGVLILEALAQLSGYLLGDTEAREGRRVLAIMSMVEKAKFRKMVRPGDQVRLTSVITSRHPDAATVDCKAEVDGEAVCNAKILFTYWQPTDGGQLKDLEIRQRNLLTLCQFCQVGDPPRPGDRHLAGSPA
ncbi:MAG: hydroxymyristoyl-ACP dehydratase [Cyanobacteria bacterium RYN_339]|nr:hydroxymyristoyl-ACP dehydratase [Cyanobacteria bacterium RYN_339]